jgi:hypothetical protein
MKLNHPFDEDALHGGADTDEITGRYSQGDNAPFEMT